MSINLYRVSKVNWAIVSHKEEGAQCFTNIENASEYLESIGVPSDEIDLALMDMMAKGNTRAQFGVLEGRFLFSDNARLDELLGVA
jgi:hypothetical protein